MAGIKEIRTRIDSVQQTLKITNAMYLISSSKLRRARQQLNSVQPYFHEDQLHDRGYPAPFSRDRASFTSISAPSGSTAGQAIS
ncbi:MAG: F0F1 ATP synthase subunit gamma [Butyricicoccaceae bacterium]